MITNIWYQSKKSFVWDADFLAFWAMTSGTPTAWKNIYNDAFLYLKSSGLWSKADSLFLLSGHNQNDSLIDLKRLVHGVPHNSPVFTAKNGFTGGSLKYIDTQYNPAVDGVNWTLNNAGLYVWVNSPNTGGNKYHAGAYSTGGNASSIASDASSVEAVNGGFVPLGIPADIIGVKGNSRSSSSVVRAFWNDNFYNRSSVSNTVTPLDIYLLTLNEAGAPGNFYSNAQLSFSYAGAALTDSEAQEIKLFNLWWFSQMAAL